MVESLKTTKFNDGISIPFVSDDATWRNLTTPGYCFYQNDDANKNTYGAKSMASTSGWNSSSTSGCVGNDQASNNSSGFAGLPGGFRPEFCFATANRSVPFKFGNPLQT